MKRGVAGVCAWVALSCGGGWEADDGDRPRAPEAPVYEVSYVPGCEGFDYGICDVRAAECQTRLLELAVCLRRDEDATLPPITFFTEEQWSDFLATEYPEPAPDPNHYEDALELLNLVTDGSLGLDPTAMAAFDVSGFYRYIEDDVYLILRDIDAKSAEAMEILLHELVHGLQDRELDLNSYHELYSDDYDSFLASKALIEGEARFQELRLTAALNGLNPDTVDFAKAVSEGRENWDEWLAEQESLYTETHGSFPYAHGAVLVQRAFAAAGQSGIRELFATPPVHTQHVMADNWDGIRFEGPLPGFQRPTPALPERLVATNTLGAWGAYMMLIESDALATDARLLSLEWRGDDLAVYGNDLTGDTSLLWQLEFSDATRAESFAAAVGATLTGAVRVGGARVRIGISTAPLADWLFEVEP